MTDTLWTQKIYTKTGFQKEDILEGARALDIGCGGRKLPGSIGIDILSLPGVDVVHDLSRFPWPFEDDSFDLVFASHFLEHTHDVIKTLEEIHRILKPSGRAVIQVPYFRCIDAVVDPTHEHYFASQSLDYVVEGTPQARYSYSSRKFKKVGFWYGWPHPSSNPLKQVLKSFIASRPIFYDQYLSVFLPSECLTWELEAVK